MEIHERIKEAREKAGLTQKEVATKMNILRQQYGRYENGQNEIPASKLKAFCEICKADANWILGIGESSIEN